MSSLDAATRRAPALLPASGPLLPVAAAGAAVASAFAIGLAAGVAGTSRRRRRQQNQLQNRGRRPRANPHDVADSEASVPGAGADVGAGTTASGPTATEAAAVASSALLLGTPAGAVGFGARESEFASRDRGNEARNNNNSANASVRRRASSRAANDDVATAAPAALAALDCPVCLGEVLVPRVAPCGHSLCTPCLVELHAHERRPACPVCRARIRVPVDRLPVNFALKTLVEACVASRGPESWEEYVRAEEGARAKLLAPWASSLSPSSPAASDVQAGHGGGDTGTHGTVMYRGPRRSIVAQLRPAWNWCKWSVIIVTELCAFLVSLKEVIEATPSRTRRYQRIV